MGFVKTVHGVDIALRQQHCSAKAQLYCITQSLGGAVLLPQSDIDAMHGFYEAHYRKRQLGEE